MQLLSSYDMHSSAHFPRQKHTEIMVRTNKSMSGNVTFFRQVCLLLKLLKIKITHTEQNGSVSILHIKAY